MRREAEYQHRLMKEYFYHRYDFKDQALGIPTATVIQHKGNYITIDQAVDILLDRHKQNVLQSEVVSKETDIPCETQKGKEIDGMSDVLFTPVGRLSFTQLFTPRAMDTDSEPKYSTSIIFDKAAQETAEYEALRKAVAKAATDKFGADFELRKLKHVPLKDCKDKDHYTGYEDPDGKYLSASTKTRPGICDINLQDILNPAEVYSGCLARLSVSCYAYDHPKGGKGVSLALRNVQVLNNDEEQFPRLDGRASASHDFGSAGDIDSALAGGSASASEAENAGEELPF